MASLRRIARRFLSSTPEKLEHTALYNLHVELGGKMVPFAGYALPVQYPDGVLASHLRTRQKGCASLFDVGHMGQIRWHGKDRAKFLEKMVVADVADIKVGLPSFCHNHCVNTTVLSRPRSPRRSSLSSPTSREGSSTTASLPTMENICACLRYVLQRTTNNRDGVPCTFAATWS